MVDSGVTLPFRCKGLWIIVILVSASHVVVRRTKGKRLMTRSVLTGFFVER